MTHSATKDYVLRKIVDESILVPISPNLKNRDCLFVLNPTACLVYEGVVAGKSMDSIVDTVLEAFEGTTREEVSMDVQALLDELLEIQAITGKA